MQRSSAVASPATAANRSAPLNMLLLGGCMVHWPVVRVPYSQGRLAWTGYGPVGEVHSFGEIMQILDVLQGRKDVPPELRPFAHMKRELQPTPKAQDFADVDLALLGPSSPIELMFRGVHVNRTTLMKLVAAAVEDDETGVASKLLGRWCRVGLVGLNEAVRAEAGEKLLTFMTRDGERAELARAAVRETRAGQGDVLAGFQHLQRRLQCPMGIVLYIFRYMPDGRPISWPADFGVQVLDAAKALGIPVFDPTPMIVEYGVAKALRSGHSHYSHEFLPVIGRAIIDFAENVHSERAGVPSA